MNRDLCDEVKARITEFLSPEGVGSDRAALETHVSQCQECKMYLQDTKALSVVIMRAGSVELSQEDVHACLTYLDENWETYEHILQKQFDLFQSPTYSQTGDQAQTIEELVSRAVERLSDIPTHEGRVEALWLAVSDAVADLVPNLKDKVSKIWEDLIPSSGNLGAIPAAARFASSAVGASVTEDEATGRELIRMASRLNKAARRGAKDVTGLCDDLRLTEEAQALLLQKVLSPPSEVD